jgi:glycosyltransferase involved in cell wall biosynthesis
MKISFIIPAHNEEALIATCIESVQREIARANCEAEIIVVNNASTDRTGDIVRAATGVRLVDEPRKGLTRARQSGFDVSGGDLIANIDADTMLPPGWIDKALKEFGADSKLVGLSGPFHYYDLPFYKRVPADMFIALYPLVNFVLHEFFGIGAVLQGGNFVLRRSALQQTGGFDTSISFYGEDTDMARRISKFGKVKWTLSFPILASGRRIMHEGLLRMGARYSMNFFWTTFAKKPWTTEHVDVRHDTQPATRR